MTEILLSLGMLLMIFMLASLVRIGRLSDEKGKEMC